jgi:hypothetical protein
MKSIIIILGLLCGSCSTTKQIKHSSDKIIGRWCSVSNTADYPHLTFRQDGYVIFDCKVDTIFGLKYSIANNYLQLMRENKPITKNKILKFTQDSLVFETLLELKMQQVYYRCDK